MSPDAPPPDVLANVAARELLLDLADHGINLWVRRGHIVASAANRLTEADRAAICRHKGDLMVLILLTSHAVLDRLLALRRGHAATVPLRTAGACYMCGAALPADRLAGRCGPCALATRLYAGGPIPPDVIALFPEDVRGPQVAPGRTLLFDVAVPA